jgi:uncharacterized protein (DUF2267 family)
MSAQGLEGLDHTVQLTHIWINDLDKRLDWNDKARSYRLLKAVLHALRDSLHVNEAADLGAQLPGLLRGAYYEQWRPATTPQKLRSIDSLVEYVSEVFRRDPLPDPPKAIMAVFQLLTRKITHGEIEDVRRCLPKKLRDFWVQPESKSRRPH